MNLHDSKEKSRGVLALMFSTTGSIAAYKRQGSYQRFMRLLHAYAQHFEQVHVCTFDTTNYTAEWGITNTQHHPMPKLPAVSIFYHLLSPFLHRRALRPTTVIRTFNITGALPALLLRWRTKALLFVSYGYSLPDFIRFESGIAKYYLYRLVEHIALSKSDFIITATPAQNRQLGDLYGSGKTIWIPNFVDAERFSPNQQSRSDFALYVGRLTPQKNLHMLLQAMALAEVKHPLKIVGMGELEPSLRTLAKELRLSVEFAGVLPNEVLPRIYQSAWAFILPSLFEGLPKVLLEAMSCATPCIGTDVTGIRDLIVDGENGILAQPTVEGIAAALRRIEDDGLRDKIGGNARKTVEEKFSMNQVLARELAYLDGIGL